MGGFEESEVRRVFYVSVESPGRRVVESALDETKQRKERVGRADLSHIGRMTDSMNDSSSGLSKGMTCSATRR
jgi:hypothetical protein